MLHYVALAPAPASRDALLDAAAPFPDLLILAQALTSQWVGLSPGFHRLTFEHGNVLLTLCVGEVTAMLREQQFVADTVFLHIDHHLADGPAAWDLWAVKALARCCRRGSVIAVTSEASHCRAALVQCGFEIGTAEAGAESVTRTSPSGGVFNPRWTLKKTREPAPSRVTEPGTCAVIGAGLAGASVAASLARRGWRVQVLDQGDVPAAGASGLPVGLVVPHVSVDDCALSRLSRSGVRLMLHQAQELLIKGQDWRNSGTLERRMDGPQTPSEIWHANAAWLKPRQMVLAWLAQPGITFLGNTKVNALRQCDDGWLLLNEFDAVVARVNRVVFANAGGALPLIERLHATHPELDLCVHQIPSMHGVRGQLSWAMHVDAPDPAFPPYPVNGSGSVVPAVPVDNGLAWFVGSNYQPESKPPQTDFENHAANLARLSQLLPALGQALAPQFEAGTVKAWKNVRCVTADRLPAVGPLDMSARSGLWVCAGMGSRGLSFSVLCAELLAARWSGEPLPVDTSLARTLYALRNTKSRQSSEPVD